MIIQGDSLVELRKLPDESVHCCVTSPPYWGLRDYGVEGQLGLESTPEGFISKMVEVFREVRRVLRSDGTLWLNIGDSYAAGGKGGGGSFMDSRREAGWQMQSKLNGWRSAPPGLKAKDLVGIPWMLAFALRTDGWYLRQDIIWSKPNPMPESVTDRCTKAHEYLFLLSKSSRYYCDMEAIKEPCQFGDRGISFNSEQDVATKPNLGTGPRKVKVPGGWDVSDRAHGTIHLEGRTAAQYTEGEVSTSRNKRSVWEISTAPFPEAHFATFPPKLVEPCILAGCPQDGTVLDPFSGAGTTGVVARRLGRNYIGIELNPEYCEMARNRIRDDNPLFNS